jgi:hypothetical protein
MEMTMPDADGPPSHGAVAPIGLPKLNLPAYEPVLRGDGEKRLILDPVRQLYVRLTPEEWVRQHFLRYLTHNCGYPASLMAIEKGFLFQGMACRADILVHDGRGKPYLMVECKAPGVPIAQATFDQISRYNRVISARYLVVTNGLKHYCWTVEAESGQYSFIDGLPRYERPSEK